MSWKVFLSPSFDENSTQAHTFREWWHSAKTRSDRRVALITGASRGLGATLAGFLAGQGYDLILTARGAEALQTAADVAETVSTPRSSPWPGMSADPAHRQRLFEAAQIFRAAGCAGEQCLRSGSEPAPDTGRLSRCPLWSACFTVNVIAPVALAQLVLPLLKASEGLIVIRQQ